MNDLNKDQKRNALGGVVTLEGDVAPAKHTLKAEPEMVTLEEIKAAIKKIAVSNDYKPLTKKFRTMEFSFLQGAVFADKRLVERYPIISICLISGRSFVEFDD